jgi:NAD(P)-dependent dehydrogenase (short-subunit alcohol dehydrogenase family)
VRRFVKEWRIMLLIRLGLAAMGLFLASDDASHVNGQAIPVDGGLTASMPYAGKPI